MLLGAIYLLIMLGLPVPPVAAAIVSSTMSFCRRAMPVRMSRL
jgi:xanthosine utilization system XapX-like protein